MGHGSHLYNSQTMTYPPPTYHARVNLDRLPDWISAGWVRLNSLDATHHGKWSAHCVWNSHGEPVVPATSDADPLFGGNS